MNAVMCNHHWNYFLNIEDELFSTNRIVEFCEDNYRVYSVEYAKILLSTCSEIDVLCRMLCSEIDSTCNFADQGTRDGNIIDYFKVISSKYPRIIETEVRISRLGVSLKPLSEWSKTQSPTWWQDYNKVKHYRHSNFSKANLINCINALAALIILNVYLYRVVTQEPYASFDTFPKLFDCQYFSVGLLSRAPLELPDFQD